VIENMSYLEQDGKRVELFGNGGGELVASSLAKLSGTEVKLIGQVPISVALREGSDTGKPLCAEESQDAAAIEIHKIASLIASQGRSLAGRKLNLDPK
jgi:ATP-binding protein involved in chromosome partitioning